MGYDAIGIGDDDLGLGKDFLLEISKKANFPFLSSNIVDDESGKPLFQPYFIKETNGLKIGIFSILLPDLLASPSDPRRKGLNIRPPIETTQNIVKELQPKTDLIILLSHQGYPKDLELAQAVQGIHIIVGSHTGVSLTYPPPNKNTIILQTAPRGMYAGRLDLTLYNDEPIFQNTATKRSLESNLNSLKSRLNAGGASEAQKAQWQKSKEEMERRLQEFQGKNEFTHTMLTLSEGMKEHPDIKKMVETHKTRFPETGKPSSAAH